MDRELSTGHETRSADRVFGYRQTSPGWQVSSRAQTASSHVTSIESNFLPTLGSRRRREAAVSGWRLANSSFDRLGGLRGWYGASGSRLAPSTAPARRGAPRRISLIECGFQVPVPGGSRHILCRPIRIVDRSSILRSAAPSASVKREHFLTLRRQSASNCKTDSAAKNHVEPGHEACAVATF